MKDIKFKKLSSDKYNIVRESCTNWNNKNCNNGMVSIKGLRQCYSWKDAYIVLCNNVYMAIPFELFQTV